MPLPESIGLFIVIALVSGLVAFPLRWLLIRGRVLDIPQRHASHDRTIPRGGGLLTVAAFFLWFVFADHRQLPALNWVAAGVGAVATISFIDDIWEQSRRLRFAVFALAAAVFVAAIFNHQPFASWGQPWLLAFVLWLWVAGYANAFNFIDGIDGLAATQAIVALLFGATFCALASGDRENASSELISLQLVLAASLAGFLFHNFPKARLFLGDVGSVSTGYLLAVIVVIATAELGLRTGLALASLHLGPVLDTSITVFRRLKNRKAIHRRHRDFFFHRAIRSGRSHPFVTAGEFTIQVAGALLVTLAYVNSKSMSVLLIAIGIAALFWLGFFAWCERQLRRSKSDL